MKFGKTLPIKLSPAPETAPSLRNTDDERFRLRVSGFTLVIEDVVLIIRP